MTNNESSSKKEQWIGKQRKFWIQGLISISFFLIFWSLYNWIEGNLSSRNLIPYKDCKINNIIFSCPVHWVVVSTPYGNHGDMDVVAVISAPFFSLPRMVFSQKEFQIDDIKLVEKWREDKLKHEVRYEQLVFETLSENNLERYVEIYRLNFKELECRDIYFIKNKTGFIINFCAYVKDINNYGLILEQIQRTLKYLED